MTGDGNFIFTFFSTKPNVDDARKGTLNNWSWLEACRPSSVREKKTIQCIINNLLKEEVSSITSEVVRRMVSSVEF